MRTNNNFSDNATANTHCLANKRSKIVAGCVAPGLLVLAVVGIAATLIGCSSTGSNQAQTSPAQAQANNSALEGKIKTNLNSDEQLKASNLNVVANADRNEVTLTGTVESEAAKTKAVESAKSAQAGLTVTSKMEVDPSCCGGPHGGREGMPGMKGLPGMKGMPPGGEHGPHSN